MTFIKKLRKRQKAAKTMVCVGLDTDKDLLPISTGWLVDPVLTFNKAIIDATHPFVCAYKINIAFYSISGWLGAVLKDTIDYIHTRYPDIPVILDAKRGDIGNSAKKYAKELFDRFKADAITVNPYLGQDSCQPFLDRADKGVIILCRTSNDGAKDFQDLPVIIDEGVVPGVETQALPFYQCVARKIAADWNKNGNCLLVVGATYPEELGEVRKVVGDMPILVPGVGAQGGDLEGVIRNGLDSTGYGLMINSSRGIIYASKGEDFAQAAARAAKELRDQINKIKKSLRRK